MLTKPKQYNNDFHNVFALGSPLSFLVHKKINKGGLVALSTSYLGQGKFRNQPFNIMLFVIYGFNFNG